MFINNEKGLNKTECQVIPDVSDDPALTQDMVYLILQSMFQFLY